MNRLKQHLNDRLRGLELTPESTAAVLARTSITKEVHHKLSRTAIILLVIFCLSCLTITAATLRSWGHTTQGFMTWEEYQKVNPYAFEAPPAWDADQKHYVIDYHLDIPAYAPDFNWEQENKLYHYRNDQKDANGGVFSYTTLEEAQQELGICYLQSDVLSLDGPVSMRVAGSHRLYQLVAKYQLSAPDKGCSLSMQAILHQAVRTDFIIATYPEQLPEIADSVLKKLNTDVTLVKFSDTQVMYLLLADTISYNGFIRFDAPPEDPLSAALEILETLHH